MKLWDIVPNNIRAIKVINNKTWLVHLFGVRSPYAFTIYSSVLCLGYSPPFCVGDIHLCFVFEIYILKKILIFSTYFLQLVVLILCKFIISVRNNFTNDEHVFLRILVTNLRVLYFDINAIPTMCTPYYKSRLNLLSEICLVNILTFSAWGVTVIF